MEGNVLVRSALLPLVLSYTRRELPAWGRVMVLAGGETDRGWPSKPLVRTRYKWTPYSAWLDLADPVERYVYFSGRYYDLGPQLALRHILRPGGTFVDIGANIGLMTLLAAHAVGPTGVVHAFEPNPDCCERLQLHVVRNGLTHVHVHPVGLGEQDSTLLLTRDTGSSVHGSFAPPADEATVIARYSVPVRRGDEFLGDAPSNRPMVVKIDVEGFECRVLQGLAATIKNHTPTVLTEVVPAHLTRAGSSVAELFDLMHGFGYAGSAITTVRAWTQRLRLNLVPVTTPETMPHAATDVLWTPVRQHG